MKRLIFLLVLACAQQVYSQLITYSGIGLQTMVGNDFLGPNFTVSNVTFTGNPNSIGEFDATNTFLTLKKGIIINTGSVIDTVIGPFGPNNSGSSGTDNQWPGSEYLSNFVGGTPTFNSAILEFDFIPNVDTLNIEFIFGSEEYPEYVGSNFNDFFGFFLSGPGIPSELNIATLPSGQAISINSVNNGTSNSGPCTNCGYYTNNGDGSNGPFNMDSSYIQYDGLIEGLTAHYENLQIGSTYHLKIAITDVGDQIYDSGLFIASCPDCNYAVNNVEIANENIIIYPNPGLRNDLIHVTGMDNGNYKVCNLNGQIISSGIMDGAISTAGLNSGSYILELDDLNLLFRTIIVIK